MPAVRMVSTRPQRTPRRLQTLSPHSTCTSSPGEALNWAEWEARPLGHGKGPGMFLSQREPHFSSFPVFNPDSERMTVRAMTRASRRAAF